MWGVPENIEKLIRPKLDEFMTRELDNFYKALAGEKIPDSDSGPVETVKNGIRKAQCQDWSLTQSGALTQ